MYLCICISILHINIQNLQVEEREERREKEERNICDMCVNEFVGGTFIYVYASGSGSMNVGIYKQLPVYLYSS